jgi:NADH-quinone oxidoreductase subunit N
MRAHLRIVKGRATSSVSMLTELFSFFFPEILLVSLSFVLLIYGTWASSIEKISKYALTALSLTALSIIAQHGSYPLTCGFFHKTAFLAYAQLSLIFCGFLALFFSQKQYKTEGLHDFEYPVLILLSLLGGILGLGCEHILVLFLCLECQALSFYILMGLSKFYPRSSEASIKYFIFGSLSSVLFLYGASLIYTDLGCLDIQGIMKGLTAAHTSSLAYLGFSLIIIALCLKLFFVPFHWVLPDLYQGLPLSVLVLLGTAPKITLMIVLITLFQLLPVQDGGILWALFGIFGLSMVLSALAGVQQHNIRRLLAYSSIGHFAFIALGLLTPQPLSFFHPSIVYLCIYILTTLGIFALLLSQLSPHLSFDSIEDLKKIQALSPRSALILAFLFISLAGIPPFPGFFAKFLVLYPLVQQSHYAIVALALVSSLISTAYYLRIIKNLLFPNVTPPNPSSHVQHVAT